MFYSYREESLDIPIWTLRYVTNMFLSVGHAFSFYLHGEKPSFAFVFVIWFTSTCCAS